MTSDNAMTVDEEFTALAKICDEFDKFDERTANRVIWYLRDKYLTNRKPPQLATARDVLL